MSQVLPREVLEKVFNYITTLHGIAKISLLSSTWHKVTCQLFACIRRNKWLVTFIESYLVEHDWLHTKWDQDCKWHSTIQSTPMASFIDQFGNVFEYEKNTLFKNNIPLLQLDDNYTLKGRYSIAVDEVTRDTLVLFQGIVIASTIFRLNEAGVVLSKLVIPYCLSGIVVHGNLVYAITQPLANKQPLFLKMDSTSNSIVESKVQQNNVISRSLVGISKDGSKIYMWLKRMVWNTQYDVNEHTLVTLDNSGNIVSMWSTENEIVSMAASDSGFWYIYALSENFQLGVHSPIDYTTHEGLLGNFASKKEEPWHKFIIYQLRTNPARGSIFILGKFLETRKPLLIECKLGLRAYPYLCSSLLPPLAG